MYIKAQLLYTLPVSAVKYFSVAPKILLLPLLCLKCRSKPGTVVPGRNKRWNYLPLFMPSFLPFYYKPWQLYIKRLRFYLKGRWGDEDWVFNWDHGDPDSSPPSTMEAQWIISATCSLRPIHLIGFLWDKMGESKTVYAPSSFWRKGSKSNKLIKSSIPLCTYLLIYCFVNPIE